MLREGVLSEDVLREGVLMRGCIKKGCVLKGYIQESVDQGGHLILRYPSKTNPDTSTNICHFLQCIERW